MTEDTRKNFVAWLRDAHAMEEQAVSMLSTQAQRLEHYPELRSKIDSHLSETKTQVQRLEQLMKRYDTSASTMKDLGAKFSANLSALGDSMSGDEVMKGAMMGYTFEHFEISAYAILVATARALGDEDAQRTLQGILDEEKAMADWMGDHLEPLTASFLAREEADMAAKR